MELRIDTTRVVILADVFGATMKQMEAAEIRALNKTVNWVRSKAVRSVAKEMKVAAKLVRQRIAAFKATRRKRYGKVWAGLKPIAAHRLGKAKQTRRGVRAGSHSFKGAFAVNSGTGKLAVFQRTGEPKRKMRSGRYTGKMREPIELVELELDQQKVTDALEELLGSAQQRFFELFKQELKYQVFVKNAR